MADNGLFKLCFGKSGIRGELKELCYNRVFQEILRLIIQRFSEL